MPAYYLTHTRPRASSCAGAGSIGSSHYSPGSANLDGADAVLFGTFPSLAVLSDLFALALICGASFMSAYKSLATMTFDPSMAAQ